MDRLLEKNASDTTKIRYKWKIWSDGIVYLYWLFVKRIILLCNYWADQLVYLFVWMWGVRLIGPRQLDQFISPYEILDLDSRRSRSLVSFSQCSLFTWCDKCFAQQYITCRADVWSWIASHYMHDNYNSIAAVVPFVKHRN